MNKNTLVIPEVPFGITSSLIESIIKANDKGKIKIKRIQEQYGSKGRNFCASARWCFSGKTIDALFAFSSCEIAIFPLTLHHSA
ncbi:MAG: hypothetical protein U5K51_14300 [Flavobacteriaceae bacterium]|nr:hypothetical protein [Flavobacteriaceae bacterium]